MLLEHNANVSAEKSVIATTPYMVQNPGCNGDTALHLAAKGGRAEVVKVLLEAKAQVCCLGQVRAVMARLPARRGIEPVGADTG